MRTSRRNSRDDQLSDEDNYDRRGVYSKEPPQGRPRGASRGSRPQSSDEEPDQYDNRRATRRDRTPERDTYRSSSGHGVAAREVDDSRLYDLEQENSPEKQTNVRMISRSRPSANGRMPSGRPSGAFVPKDVRSSGNGRPIVRGDNDPLDDRRRSRGDSYDNNSTTGGEGNYEDHGAGRAGRYRDQQDGDYYRREQENYNNRDRDMRSSRDNNRENRSSNYRDYDQYSGDRDLKPQPTRQSYESFRGGRDREYEEESLGDDRRQSSVRASRDRPPRPSYADDYGDMEPPRDDRRRSVERDGERERQGSAGRIRGQEDAYHYPDKYAPRINQQPPQQRRLSSNRENDESDPRLNESLRAERGSWTAPVENRSRKESGGSDFEIVSDQDDNRLEEDSIEEIQANNERKPNRGSSYRDAGRGGERQSRNNGMDDEYRAPAGSFGHYITKQEEQGITLPRKSGRYDDQPDDRESGSDRFNAPSGSAANASGSWMTGGPPVKISTPPPTTSHLAPATFSHTSRNSFVLVAHPRGMRTQHVQCTIIRDRTSMQGKLYPTYELILEEPRKTLIIAQKMSLNRTSNYHLFDMTRGQAGSKLSKKSGNYLGKLRAKNVNRTGYALVNSKSDREEVGGVLFDRVTMIDQIKDGNQPRRMTVLIPPTDDDGLSIPVPLNSLGVESLTDLLQAIEENKRVIPDHFALMHTKDPVFENGNYRLNFHGRVSMPSVKNFQMVSDDDIEDIKCQFGKVDKDIFHLDYKAPFNALQAFALALCQFNL